MSAPLRHGVLFFLVLLAGLWLRTHELALRPMHADEANQAVKLGQLLAGGGYRFDPADHHGPTLYYLALLPARLRGEGELAALTETTVRLTPALAGTVAIALLWLLLRPLDPWPALAGALFLAVSPPAVYYSRYFIQESLLVTFTLAALVAGARWWRTGATGWALAAGGCAGLMFATKASALLYAGAALVALVASGGRDGAATAKRLLRLWPGLVAAVLVWAAFASSFGANLAGLGDALATFSPMSAKAVGGVTGHEKPWWYYGGLFLFQRNGGYFWDQTVFLLLALAGVVVAFRGGHRTARFWALATLLGFAALSLAPYKTPWNVVNVVPGFCALAAVALGRLRPWSAAPLALAAVLVLGWQTGQAAFWRPADSRNPYAYVHTSSDILKLARLLPTLPAGPVKVISDEVWPLPWYLRSRPEVGYWPAPPADCDGALVIVAADQAEAVQEKLRGRYRSSYVGLRPGFVLVVFTPAADPAGR